MSNLRHVNAIAGRMSLRAPQRESLEILDRVTEIVSLSKKQSDLVTPLATIRSEFPSVTDFEREFPSLCFALATGVGKTRLMGAFVTYLQIAHGINNFFVLAPNLTIYNKLIADFTPNTPKYVFKGVAEFAAYPPEIITGDNYESGRGVRRYDLFGDVGIHINVFNRRDRNARALERGNPAVSAAPGHSRHGIPKSGLESVAGRPLWHYRVVCGHRAGNRQAEGRPGRGRRMREEPDCGSHSVSSRSSQGRQHQRLPLGSGSKETLAGA